GTRFQSLTSVQPSAPSSTPSCPAPSRCSSGTSGRRTGPARRCRPTPSSTAALFVGTINNTAVGDLLRKKSGKRVDQSEIARALVVVPRIGSRSGGRSSAGGKAAEHQYRQ